MALEKGNVAMLDTLAVSGIYVVDPVEWGISIDKTNADATTDGINAALAHAKSEGFEHICSRAGNFLINGHRNSLPSTFTPSHTWAGIIVPSGITWWCHPDAIFTMETSQETYATLLTIIGVNHVTICGGVFVGDKFTYDYVTTPIAPNGHGYGIQITDCHDIRLQRVTIKDCVQDCVIIGGDRWSAGGNEWPTYYRPYNIWIENCHIESARRNNITIVDVTDCWITDNKLIDAGKTYGQAPQAGLDIEAEIPNGMMAYNVHVKGNIGTGNISNSLVNYNGENIEIIGNIVDTTINPCNYGHNVIVSDNICLLTAGIGVGTGANLTTDLNVLISRNQLLGTGKIRVSGNAVQIWNNILKGNYIHIYNSRDIDIDGNTVDNDDTGIFVQDQSATKNNNIRIRNNTLTGLSQVNSCGIRIDIPTATTPGAIVIENNNIVDYCKGMWVSSVRGIVTAQGNNILGNVKTIDSPMVTGITMTNIDDCMVSGNTIRNYPTDISVAAIATSTTERYEITGNKGTGKILADGLGKAGVSVNIEEDKRTVLASASNIITLKECVSPSILQCVIKGAVTTGAINTNDATRPCTSSLVMHNLYNGTLVTEASAVLKTNETLA